MERETKLSFGQIQREMGVTSSDKLAAMRYQASSYSRPSANSELETIRTMSAEEASKALKQKSLAQQAEGLEKITKIWTGMHAAIAITRGVTAALRKDWDGVGDAIRDLPFGIGSLSGAVMDLKAELTGARKELEGLEATGKALDVIFTGQRTTVDAVKESHRQTAIFVADMVRQMQSLGMTGLGKNLFDIDTGSIQRRRQVTDEFEAQAKALREQIAAQRTALTQIPQNVKVVTGRAEVGTESGTYYTETVENRINPAYVAALKAIDQTSSALAQLEKDKNAKLAAINELSQKEQWQARVDAAKAEGKEVLHIRAETARIEMELDRRENDARIQAIKDGAKEQADAYREAGQVEAAAAIEAQANLAIKLEQQKQADEARKNSLESRRGALQGRLEGLSNDLSAMSGAKLPLLTAFANPGIYTTGQQQREGSLKGEMQQVRRAIEETNRILRDDKAVRVGNN